MMPPFRPNIVPIMLAAAILATLPGMILAFPRESAAKPIWNRPPDAHRIVKPDDAWSLPRGTTEVDVYSVVNGKPAKRLKQEWCTTCVGDGERAYLFFRGKLSAAWSLTTRTVYVYGNAAVYVGAWKT